MLRSNKLFTQRSFSTLLGGYVPNSSIEASRFSTSSKTNPTEQKFLAANGLLPDPSKAILRNKIFHYSTIGLAICLPASILLPSSGLTTVTDVVLSVVLPAHLFLGLNAVINDYIYTPFLRKPSVAVSAIVSAIVGAGVLTLSFREDGFGTVIRKLWDTKATN